MLRICKDKHIHRFSPDNKPVACVDSGTRMIFEAMDGLEGVTFRSDGALDYPAFNEHNTNPATGPVFIRGAQPGDALEVEIHDIRVTTAGYFHLYKDMISRDGIGNEYVQLEIQGSKIIFDGRMLPARPMIGVIGSAPVGGKWCRENGNHGGNMDARIIEKGAKLLLPVFVEGGMLALGDLHAAQGDGEVFGQGLEVGGEAELTATVKKDISLQWPVVVGTDRLACIVSDMDIKRASYLAMKEIGHYLVTQMGLSQKQAGTLIALYGNLILCQIVNPLPTIRMEIKREFIDLFTAV